MDRVRKIRPNQILTVDGLLRLNIDDEIIYHHDATPTCREYTARYIFEGVDLSRTSLSGKARYWLPGLKYRLAQEFNSKFIYDICLSDCGVIPYDHSDGSISWNSSNWLEKPEKPNVYTIEEAMEEPGVYGIDSKYAKTFIITNFGPRPIYYWNHGAVLSGSGYDVWRGQRRLYKTDKVASIVLKDK